MQLPPEQFDLLAEALEDAFSISELELFFNRKIGEPLENIVSLSARRSVVVMRVIEVFQSRDLPTPVPGVVNYWQFLQLAREWKPANAKLLAFTEQYGLAPEYGYMEGKGQLKDQLETILDEDNPFYDVTLFREALGRIEVQVCLIRINGRDAGTGFLVGPDTVMTNFHVIQSVYDREDAAQRVTVVFDHKYINANGTLIKNEGETVKVDEDEWLIDFSPYSEFDKRPDEGDPEETKLDYALLRLGRKVGSLPIGEKRPDRTGKLTPRGWVETDPNKFFEKARLKPNAPVFIFQHPGGQPMKLNFDRIDGLNEAGTRIRYLANTSKGSSGSPVFDGNWNLIALHHYGRSDHNQGIPFTQIRALLKQHDKLDALGG